MKRIPLTSILMIACFLFSSCAPEQPAAEPPPPAETAAPAPPAAPAPTSAPTPTARPTPPPLPSVEVTGVGDLINGNRESAEKFIADPGPDGMGLREALMLANSASGPTVITFAPALAGQTITLGADLGVTREGITIEGLTGADGKPAVTIVAAKSGRGGMRVTASHVTIRGLRIVGLESGGVRAGVFLQPAGRDPLTDILIENNILEGAGEKSSDGISLRTEGLPDMMATTIRDVIIRGNTLTDFMADCDGIHIGAPGKNSVRENILVSGNTFLRDRFPVELEDGGTNNTIRNVRIIGNHFAENMQAVSIGPIGEAGKNMSGSLIADTLISGNTFENNKDAAIVIVGGYQNDAPRTSTTGNTVRGTHISHNIIRGNQKGVFIFGGFAGADSNQVTDTVIEGNLFQANQEDAVGLVGGSRAKDSAIRNTQIVNNIMSGQRNSGIYLCGGDENAAGDELQGVQVINNTIVSSPAGVSICNNADPASALSGLQIRNTIFWSNGQDFHGLSPEMVDHSITRQAGFAGVGQNIAADPSFINPAGGDYHLAAGSPAVDAGSADGAPPLDYECSPRVGAPDIGAYEFDDVVTECPAEGER